jgi:hypothetical protein
MAFEHTRWYQVSTQLLALVCSFLMLEAASVGWSKSFVGILILVLCADGIERLLKAIGAVAGALLTSRR